MIDTNKLNIKQKIELFKKLGKEISSKGVNGDTELAPVSYTHLTLPTIYSV